MRGDVVCSDVRTTTPGRSGCGVRRVGGRAGGSLVSGLILGLLASGPVEAQPMAGVEVVNTTSVRVQGVEVLKVAMGNSLVVTHPATLERVSIGNPEIADAVVVSANEVVVNGKRPGTTTLLIWDGAGGRAQYAVRVTADAPTLEEEIRLLFPEEEIRATAVGNAVVLTGSVRDARVAGRAELLARTLGENVTVVNDISVPSPDQVLLQVRFAEVSRNALDELGSSLLFRDGENVVTGIGPGDVATGEADVGRSEGSRREGTIGNVFSDAVNFFFFHRPSQVSAFFRALREQGLFKSLAEPNLLVMSGDSASFLAGGEFPFPVLQSAGAGTANAVTIQFKEFGIRLNFSPVVTPGGSIRLRVAPEVSALDFASGLTISGFQVPALTSRRAETTVDLQDGQTFAIAGLIDNSLNESVSKVPILGDIPILGALFKSKTFRENHTELLVLITPRLVGPVAQAPPVPTGEPETWKGKEEIRERSIRQPAGWRPTGEKGPIGFAEWLRLQKEALAGGPPAPARAGGEIR